MMKKELFEKCYMKAEKFCGKGGLLFMGKGKNSIFGVACELFAKEWLKENGWKIIDVLNFTQCDLSFFDKGKFRLEIKPPYLKYLSKTQLRYIEKHGIVGDFLAMKDNKFYIIEVKASQQNTSFFKCRKSQEERYKKQVKEGIPVKFIFMKVFDNEVEEFKICDYPKDVIVLKGTVRPRKLEEIMR